MIGLAPLLPVPVLAGLALLAAVPLALAVWRRAPGAGWRALGAVAVLAWLAGPTVTRRVGTALPDIALLVVDRSASMEVGDRAALAEAAAATLLRTRPPGLEVRRIDVPEAGSAGTRLFAAIAAAEADIPADRRAGVVALTDGMVADVPPKLDTPLTALIAARGEQTDRSLRVLAAPGFGVVGQGVQVRVQVDDRGPDTGGGTAHLRWSLDGDPVGEAEVPVGAPFPITVPVAHAGATVLAVTADARPGEASLLNNRAAVTIQGVRDRLRVLLISGAPNPDERTWRRLLKADPAVDLVHFTILRPPGKDDGTPIDQLALIAFPTRQLFVDKLPGFDLIVLDRFDPQGLLPAAYIRNIAEYVRQGGALLVDAGPEFAAPGGIADGPLAEVLPALPDPDGVVTGAFRPAVTALGRRHPVTAALPGDTGPDADAGWGSWNRRIAATPAPGRSPQVVMPARRAAGAGAAPPLLLLDRVGQGRVALLLSDQVWLWSRGWQGGGPQAELLRRVAHWLMQQPDLDETALTARIDAGRLVVRDAAIDPDPAATTVAITAPDGSRHDAPLIDTPQGRTASIVADQPGAWVARLGARTAVAAATPADAAELADLRATATLLAPVAQRVAWLGRGMPGWDAIALRRQHALRLTGIETYPLLPAWAALAVGIAAVLAGWWRERR